MERKYFLRKNFKSVYSESGKEVCAHLAFKTRNALWVGTSSPTLALISTQSHFHEGKEGALKMEAFLSIIRSSIQKPVSILIADTAHLEARRLIEGEFALSNSLQEAEALIARCKPLFTGHNLIRWHSLEQDEEFSLMRSKIVALAHSDAKFLRLLEDDARSTLTQKRRDLYLDQAGFIQNTIEDLMSQCACLQLLGRLGYRYLFYPGAPYSSFLYLDALMPSQVEWIDVFLTIERKTIRVVL